MTRAEERLVIQVGFGSPRRPNVSITFLGYANDSTNSRLAKFAVSNLSSSAVTQLAPFLVVERPAGLTSVPGGSFGFQIRTPTGWTAPSNGFLPGNAVLGAGASEVLGFAPPTNEPLWRIHFRVHPDVGATAVIKRKVAYALWGIGLRPTYNMMPSGFDSDWIEGER